MTSFPIYHLEAKIERCRLHARLNDMPVVELHAEGAQPEWFAPPINLYLMKHNSLVLEVSPLPRLDGSTRDFRDVQVEGAVRVYGKGDVVAPGEGPVLANLDVMGEISRRVRDAEERRELLPSPQSFRYDFETEGPDFTAELAGSEPLVDEEALRDYAIHLRDLARAGDMSGLALEMEPKIQAYAAAYAEDVDTIRQSLRQALLTEYLPAGFVTDFERSQVELSPCAGRRLYELRRPDGLPLLQTPPDVDEGTRQIVIVVGRRDGALRVVR